jgi:hypothetical protein
MQEQLSESDNLRETISKILEDLEQLLDRVKRAEYDLRNANEGDEAWGQAVGKIQNALSHYLVMLQLSYAVVSTGRKVSFPCMMPNQPSHSHHEVYTCTSNTTHKFCRSHDLVNCPITTCGGLLQ